MKQLVKLLQVLDRSFSLLKSSLRKNKVQTPSVRLYTEQDVIFKSLERYLSLGQEGKR